MFEVISRTRLVMRCDVLSRKPKRAHTCYHYCLYQLVSPSKVCHGVEDEPPLMRMQLGGAVAQPPHLQ